MTNKDKIAWALMTPLLIALAVALVIISYVTVTEQPWLALVVVVVVAAITGFCILMEE